MLGDGTVGKTSITRRFTNDEFKQSYLQTLGVDWFSKTVVLASKSIILLKRNNLLLNTYLYSNRLYKVHASNMGYRWPDYWLQNAFKLHLGLARSNSNL
mgnify:CR=1 FL=1